MKKFYNHDILGESINVSTINTLIYSLYNLLGKYSDKHFIGLFYGYHAIEPLEEKFMIAYDFLENLRNLKFRIQLDSQCPCDKDAQKLIEDVRKLVGECNPLRIDLIADSVNYEQWVLENPTRIPREVWEQCLYVRCDNITYTLARDLNNAKKECKVVYDLVKAINECKVNYKIERKTRDCTAEYDILVSEHKCQLTYNEYLDIRNCGGTFNLVKSVINCGAKIEADLKSDCLEVTYNLKKYSINCYE